MMHYWWSLAGISITEVAHLLSCGHQPKRAEKTVAPYSSPWSVLCRMCPAADMRVTAARVRECSLAGP
jgi:hypothetical protein